MTLFNTDLKELDQIRNFHFVTENFVVVLLLRSSRRAHRLYALQAVGLGTP